MAVKIKVYPGELYPLGLCVHGYDIIYLSHSELADLYLALTDYYADNGDN